MNDINFSTGWQALILTTVAAVVLKVVEWFLNRNREKEQAEVSESSEIRKELHAEVIFLKEQLNAAEAEVDNWRQKNYDAQDAIRDMREQLSVMRIAMKKLGVDLDEQK